MTGLPTRAGRIEKTGDRPLLKTQHMECALDFESPGKRFGTIALDHSDNQHAFGIIPIPVVVVKNGSGPTILLSAGNHGDEHEGQVILRKLIHELEPADISGRLIILPALNYPAVLGNTRVSPLDQKNLNRCFPGAGNGSPTEAITHFVSARLLPMADAGIDLHSGGSKATYHPSAFLCTCTNRVVMRESVKMAEIFNAPFTLVVDGKEFPTGFDPASHSLGIPFISAELSGGGSVDMNAVETGLSGVKNVLAYLGILSESGTLPGSDNAQTTFLNGISGCTSLVSSISGIFEPFCETGSLVKAGQAAGLVHSVEEIERAPMRFNFESSGVVLIRRYAARVVRGSHLFFVAPIIKRADIMKITG